MATFGVVNAAVVGAAVAGFALPVMVSVGSIGVLAAVYEALRYIVTESAITRVSLLWGMRSDASVPAALGTGPAQPLHGAPAADPLRVRVRDE
jgi:hypothetical protein